MGEELKMMLERRTQLRVQLIIVIEVSQVSKLLNKWSGRQEQKHTLLERKTVFWVGALFTFS